MMIGFDSYSDSVFAFYSSEILLGISKIVLVPPEPKKKILTHAVPFFALFLEVR